MTKHLKENDRLRKIVEAFPKMTITVLGDLIADEFVFGEISRVSREAPVLILKHRDRKVVPGGGANAIYNLADLGVTVLPVGVVGDDEPGRLLLRAFRHKRIPVSGVLKDKSYSTVTKTRILAGFAHTAGQQVVRLDREPSDVPNPHLRRELILAARQYVLASDALLVSDYGYGAASPSLLNAIREKRRLEKVPVTLDSRHRMLEFTGITAATPNESEVEAMLGIRIGNDWSRLLAAGDQILGQMNLESLVITRGKDGMVAFPRRHKPIDIANLRQRRSHRCDRSGRYCDRDFYGSSGRGRNHRRGCPARQLRRWHRGHEARNGHRQPAGITGGARKGAARYSTALNIGHTSSSEDSLA